jgi:hypothetical protein
VYGDGVEGCIPFVDGGSDGIALEAVDDEFFDFHLRGKGCSDLETRCRSCLLGD